MVPSHLACRRSLLVALLGTTALIGAQPALAQDAPADEETDVIIVTAQKREQSLQDVPIAVTAITADALDRIFSTRKLPSSTISSKARLNRKSPTRTVAGLPKTRFAVSLPRRKSDPSTTSSCSSVAVWMNSTAAASL